MQGWILDTLEKVSPRGSASKARRVLAPTQQQRRRQCPCPHSAFASMIGVCYDVDAGIGVSLICLVLKQQRM